MPAPAPYVPTGPGEVFQVTEAHGVGDIGWSETYFIQVIGGLAPGIGCLVRHSELVLIRRRGGPPGHIVETCRVSDVMLPGDSLLRFPPDANLGPCTGPVGDADPVLGYYLTTGENTGLVTNTRIYRGWQPTNLAFNPGSPRTTVPAPAALAMLIDIGKELIATRTIAGITTRYMMKSYYRPEASGGPSIQNAVGVQLTGDAKLSFVFLAPLPGQWEPGKRIHVRSPRVACVRGVAGVHTIASMEAVGASVRVDTLTPYHCAPSTLTEVTAKAFLHIDGYYQIERASVGGAGKKDAGRPFYLRRGRRSGRR